MNKINTILATYHHFRAALSENDLLGVVREIIDEHQVMDIYMDSL